MIVGTEEGSQPANVSPSLPTRGATTSTRPGGVVEFTELALDGSDTEGSFNEDIRASETRASALSIEQNGDAADDFRLRDAGDSMQDGNEKLGSDDDTPVARSGKVGAWFNFLNSIVGAGIIGLPYAVAESGVFMGMFLLLAVGYLTYVGVQTIIRCGLQVEANSYEGLCQKTLGRKGFVAVSVSMFVFAFGAMCAYMIIIGENVPHVLREGFGIIITRQGAISLMGVLVILPLCLLKDMSMLARSSSVSVLAALLIVLIVVGRGSSLVAEEVALANRTEPEPDFSFVKPRFAAGLGTISFAYVCHHSSFIVFNTLRVRTAKAWQSVAVASVGSAMFLSVLLSLGTYLFLFNEVESDILESFGPDDGWINFARLLLAFTMVLTFPMEQFVARHSVNALGWNGTPMSTARHLATTLTLWSAALLIGLVVEDLGLVLELTGATSASILGFILPATCYFKLYPFGGQWRGVRNAWTNHHPEFVPSFLGRCSVTLCLAEQVTLIVFGVFAFVIGTATSVVG